MSTVIMELAGLVGGFGFTNVLIQRRIVTRLQFDTVFWASVAVGTILSSVVFGLSYFASWIFQDPTAGDILRVQCLSFTLASLICVHEAILARLLRFKTEFLIQINVVFIRALIAITCAYLGFGVWSLVAGALGGSILSVALNVLAVPYVPRFRFHRMYLASTWRTSSSYLGGGLVYYLSMNADLALIGRSLGAGTLGIYQTARSLTDEVRARLAIPLQRVLFPAFATIQADNDRLRNTVIRSGSLLSAIVIPVGVGLSAIADNLVHVLYGDQWLGMIPIIRMLGISAALRAATAIASPIYNAKNRVGLALAHNTVHALLIIGAVIFSLPRGIEAVAGAMALSSLYSLVTFQVGLNLVGLKIQDACRILFGPTFASLVMWIALSALTTSLNHLVAHRALILLIDVIVGATIYIFMLHLVSREYLRQFRNLARKLVG